MKKRHVRFIFAVILILLTLSQTNSSSNQSSSPTPTTIQPTTLLTPILGTNETISSPSTTLQTRIQATIVKVVDGDTIHVTINGVQETIRIIGIDSPETVDPRRPVECFGIEASDKAKTLLPIGKTVELEQDLSQDNRDRYKRLLRYVFIDGVDYGKQMIAEGYAYEYTYEIPYKYQLDYKEAQRLAQENKRGLWGDILGKETKNELLK